MVGRSLWGDGPKLVGSSGDQTEDEVWRGAFAYAVLEGWFMEGASDEVIAMLAGVRAGRAERHGDSGSASSWQAAAERARHRRSVGTCASVPPGLERHVGAVRALSLAVRSWRKGDVLPFALLVLLLGALCLDWWRSEVRENEAAMLMMRVCGGDAENGVEARNMPIVDAVRGARVRSVSKRFRLRRRCVLARAARPGPACYVSVLPGTRRRLCPKRRACWKAAEAEDEPEWLRVAWRMMMEDG